MALLIDDLFNFRLTEVMVDDHLGKTLGFSSDSYLASGRTRRPMHACFDPRQAINKVTTASLTRLIDTGVLLKLGDCLSASRGSAVFVGIRGVQAPDGWPTEFAVKIRSAALKFDPSEGVFTTELPGNPKAAQAIRKCMKTEYRYITRIYSNGLPSPCPLMVDRGIVLMELITDNGAPAPSLCDAALNFADYSDLYDQILIAIRRTFQRCGLVRADVSEHTILVRQKRAVWTGAARVVECDSEIATLILRRGIAAITRFVKEKGINVAPMMRAFQFVIARRLDSGLHATLAEMRRESEQMSTEEFLGRFAPHRLAEVTDDEVAGGLSRQPGQRPFEEEEDETELACVGDSSSDEEESEEEEAPVETLHRKRFTRDEWRAKVKEIKAANRERRQSHKPRLEKREQNRRSHHNSK
jgi:serine/threonine-protein kinase RIO1